MELFCLHWYCCTTHLDISSVWFVISYLLDSPWTGCWELGVSEVFLVSCLFMFLFFICFVWKLVTSLVQYLVLQEWALVFFMTPRQSRYWWQRKPVYSKNNGINVNWTLKNSKNHPWTALNQSMRPVILVKMFRTHRYWCIAIQTTNLCWM